VRPASSPAEEAPHPALIKALVLRRCGDQRPGAVRQIEGPGAGAQLTPSRYQSGETDQPGAITKAGDARARVALFEAAHVIADPRRPLVSLD
jgi:transposase